MRMKSNPKRKSDPLMRLRLVRVCVDVISRLMFWRKSEPIGVPFGRTIDRRFCNREVVLPLDLLKRQMVILGKHPDGKNWAALSLVKEMAREYRSAQMFFLDWEADRDTTGLFGTSMTATGRAPLFFPQQPLNVCAGGNWRAVFNRLRLVIPTVRGGAAAFYEDMVSVILQLACRLGAKPPQSPEELLERLDPKVLLNAWGAEAMMGIEHQEVEAIHARFEAFFAALGPAFKGDRSFADLDAAHFSFNAVAGRSATAAARIVLAQLFDYIEYEKDPERLCFVFVRVPVEMASDPDLAMLQDQARRLGVVMVLILQMSEAEERHRQMARTLRNAETVIVNEAQIRQESKTLISLGELFDPTDVLIGRVPRAPISPAIDPEDLRSLSPGRVWMIHGRSATRVEVPDPLAS